jgi:RNA polymerase sigma-70 factor (ECF subfamily)
MTEHGTARGSRSTDQDAAFEALYSAHHRAVLAYCARRASRWDAWDAASEVFAVAWRRFGDVPATDEARAWLLGVAYRVLANQRRSGRRRRRLIQRAARAGDDGTLSPDAQLIRNKEEADVIAALSRLRPLDREILQLTLWEELSPVEIAVVLGISRAAVDQRYCRAKRRLARELKRPTLIRGRATRNHTRGRWCAMSLDIEARVRRANPLTQSDLLEQRFGEDASLRLLGDIDDRRAGRMAETTKNQQLVRLQAVSEPTEHHLVQSRRRLRGGRGPFEDDKKVGSAGSRPNDRVDRRVAKRPWSFVGRRFVEGIPGCKVR